MDGESSGGLNDCALFWLAMYIDPKFRIYKKLVNPVLLEFRNGAQVGYSLV